MRIHRNGDSDIFDHGTYFHFKNNYKYFYYCNVTYKIPKQHKRSISHRMCSPTLATIKPLIVIHQR